MMLLCFLSTSLQHAMEMVPFQELSVNQDSKCYWAARYLVKCNGKLKIAEQSAVTRFFEQRSLLSQRVQEYKDSMQDSDEKSEEFLKKVWGNTITEAYNAYCILPPAAQYQVAFCLRKNPFAFSLNREIDLYIPLDIQRKIFVLMNKEYKNNEILQEKNIESLFVGFIEYCKYKQYYEIYSKKWLITDRNKDVESGYNKYNQIKINCDSFDPLTVEEKVLLCKLINGSTIAFSCESGGKMEELTDEQKQLFGLPYVITLKELPIVQGILKRKLCYMGYRVWSNGHINVPGLCNRLKFEIECNEPTMKDKALIFIPCMMSALLPDLGSYVLRYGLLSHDDEWLSFYNVICCTSGIATVAVVRYLIGQYVFPLCEENTSQVTQLKKFFGCNVKKNKRGDDFSYSYFCKDTLTYNKDSQKGFIFCIISNYLAIVGYSLLGMQNIGCKAIGYMIHCYRLYDNYGFFKSFIIDNPLNRNIYQNFVLSDMKKKSK